MENNHTFVVLAYKESPYLEECLKSLINQSLKSKIVICTSTPNKHINELSIKYKVPIFLNSDGGSISKDWNYAFKIANTKWITLTHQDDLYYNDFLKCKIQYFKNNISVIFTNYNHIKNNKIVEIGLLIFIKTLLLFPFLLSNSIKYKFIKKVILSLGSPYCCPSATYNVKILENFKFDESLKVALDWDAWYRISDLPFSIVYLKKKLLAHRIHAESETTNMISQDIRGKEDNLMFTKIWGSVIGALIAKIYRLSYKLN